MADSRQQTNSRQQTDRLGAHSPSTHALDPLAACQQGRASHHEGHFTCAAMRTCVCAGSGYLPTTTKCSNQVADRFSEFQHSITYYITRLASSGSMTNRFSLLLSESPSSFALRHSFPCPHCVAALTPQLQSLCTSLTHECSSARMRMSPSFSPLPYLCSLLFLTLANRSNFCACHCETSAPLAVNSVRKP
jgi:hypothetical protein